MRTAPTRPAASDRGSRLPPAPARSSPTWSSCSSTRRRSTASSARCRSSARRCAARARSSSTTPANGSWPAFPARSLRRATSWRARSAARRAEGRRVFLDARAAIGRTVRGALSGHRGGLPRRGRRSGARADPGAAGAALSHGRDRRGRRGTELDRGPLGVRRGGLHRPPRRQSAGEQFADRSRRLRLDRRPLDRGRAFAPPPHACAPRSRPPRPIRRRCVAILSRAAGVTRNGEALREAAAALAALAASGGPASDPAAVALTIAVSALRRADSVGAHSRLDFPQRPRTVAAFGSTLAEALSDAAALAPEIRARRA